MPSLPEKSEGNVNSALAWWPRIEKAIPATALPRTEFVPVSLETLCAFAEGTGGADVAAAVRAVDEAAVRVGGFPVFVRTDLRSAKREGHGACVLRGPDWTEAFLGNLGDIILGSHWPQAFMVREFLRLDSRYTAFGGLPVAREFRFFAGRSQVTCHHPYWPSEAIEVQDGGEDAFSNFHPVLDARPANWRELHADTFRPLSAEEHALLSAWAMRAADACCDLAACWSVDFAQDAEGRWWLIDMADAERSWHDPRCHMAGLVSPTAHTDPAMLRAMFPKERS